MLFSGLEILGRRSKLKFLDHAFLYSGEGIVAFNISLRSTKFVTRSTFIAVACGARARSSHSTAAGLVLQDLKPHTKLTGKAHFICCAVSCRIATCGWTTILCFSETGLLRLLHVSLRVASHSSPRCTLRSSALHVSHDSWALSDPHVSSPARCEAIMGSPLSMLASHNCDTLLHFLFFGV